MSVSYAILWYQIMIRTGINFLISISRSDIEFWYQVLISISDVDVITYLSIRTWCQVLIPISDRNFCCQYLTSISVISPCCEFLMWFLIWIFCVFVLLRFLGRQTKSSAKSSRPICWRKVKNWAPWRRSRSSPRTPRVPLSSRFVYFEQLLFDWLVGWSVGWLVGVLGMVGWWVWLVG